MSPVAKKKASKRATAKKKVAKKPAAQKKTPKKRTPASSTKKKKKKAAGASAQKKKKKQPAKTTKPKAGAKKPAAKKRAAVKPLFSKKKKKKKTAARKPRKPRMTPKQVAHFRQLLLEKQQQLTHAYNVSKGDSRSDLDDGTEDYIDYAVHSYAKEFLLSLTELDRKQLFLVEQALERVGSPEYGSCESCGQVINQKRLEVAPWARYCVPCQELEEQGLLPAPGFVDPKDEDEDEDDETEASHEGELDIEEDEDDGEEKSDDDNLTVKEAE